MDHLIAQHESEFSLSRYLNKLDEKGLEKRILKYLRKDRSNWDVETFRKEVYQVLSPPKSISFALPTYTSPVEAGRLLYRARPIHSESQITQVKDVMHSPSGATAGRLNKKGESLLYTACDFSTALREIQAKPGGLVSISQFSVVRDIHCIPLNEPELSKSWTLDHRRKLKLIGNFLSTLISQRDKPYGEPDYAETEFIIKELYDFPAAHSVGWLYPSFARKGHVGINVAFRPEMAADAVSLDVVMIAKVIAMDSAESVLAFIRKLHPQPDGSLLNDDSFSLVT